MGSGAHERKSQSNYVKANDKNYFDGDVEQEPLESVSVTRLCKTAGYKPIDILCTLY